MARVGKEKVRVGERDEYMEVEFVVFVNADGEFTTTLNESDVDMIKRLNVDLRSNSRRGSRDGYFHDMTKNGLINQISNILKQCMSRTLVDEKIIIKYSLCTVASFGFTLDGGIVPNMGWSLDGPLNQELYWQKGTYETHASRTAAIGVQMYVKPYFKRTYKYLNGKEKIEYSQLTAFGGSSVENENYYLKYLEAICSTSKPEHGTLCEMDYTEDRAKFFVELFKSLCKLAHTIAQFEKPDELTKLIETGKYLMQ